MIILLLLHLILDSSFSIQSQNQFQKEKEKPTPGKSYCGTVYRSRSEVKKFEILTHFQNGRKGYVVDHIIPLCACGLDSTSNMQWQRYDSSLIKDRSERKLCSDLLKIKDKNQKGH